jgi:thiol:disulfide interchange protein DsbD
MSMFPGRLLLLLCIAFVPGFTTGAEDLLEPEAAFKFSARAVDRATIEVQYVIAPGYYLYRDKFKFTTQSGPATVGPPSFPKGIVHADKFFGRSEIYRGDVRVLLPVTGAAEHITLKAVSQGCADAGVCYVPNEQIAVLQLLPGAPPGWGSEARGAPAANDVVTSQSEEDHFRRLITSGGLWTITLAFFGAGLLLAFTPCVLPMIPILSGIIVGQGSSVTRMRAVTLSAAYVLGMAIAYTAIGIAAGMSGTLLSAALQNAWVLTAFSLIFVALALSMFGLYDLALPRFLQDRLMTVQYGLKGGRLASVALMGMLSAAIVSPCVAAPLAGALLYIGQTGDSVLGGAALFSMALGMGVPLLAVGASQGALLPKSGPWMTVVKHLFGVMLLALAIWIVSPVLSATIQLALWGLLLLGLAVFLRALDPLPDNAAPWTRFGKLLGLIALIVGAAELVGALAGADDPLKPLSVLRAEGAKSSSTPFERVRTLQELDARVRAAKTPVMLDFYADWCVSCKEMERFTFSDPNVKARLSGMVLLQADVTANSEEDRNLLKRFKLFGPPGIVFFDRSGDEIQGIRIIGYQSPERFVKALDRVVQQ